SKGVPTNALHGFAKMVITLRETIAPHYMAICFDTPVPSFRKKILTTYQAQRPKAPDEFKIQIPLAQEFCVKAKMPIFLKEGFEADDVIGTITKKAHEQLPDLHMYIFTGDKDILQLVTVDTTIIMPKIGVSTISYMDCDAVKGKMGIGPELIVDFKALVGDSSDNYSGVKGIGPKKAQDLLAKYKSLAGIYNHLEELDLRTKELLLTNRENAFVSQDLARIRTDVDVNFTLQDTAVPESYLNQELSIFLDSYSLISVKKQMMKKNMALVVVDKQDTNQLSFF
ncbi:MAG: 5'-3' exonuclease H3TH domain-containing protein, partial [Patescibacteria group bacterium]